MNSSSERNDSFGSGEFQENLELLRDTYLFSGLPLDALKVLAYVCTREKYKPGENIFVQGEDDQQAYYIVSGTAELTFRKESQVESIRTFSQGSFLGGMALLGQVPRLFSLTAQSNVSCLILARDKFLSTANQFPDILPRMVKALVENVHGWEDHFMKDRNPDCWACQHRTGVTVL